MSQFDELAQEFLAQKEKEDAEFRAADGTLGNAVPADTNCASAGHLWAEDLNRVVFHGELPWRREVP